MFNLYIVVGRLKKGWESVDLLSRHSSSVGYKTRNASTPYGRRGPRLSGFTGKIRGSVDGDGGPANQRAKTRNTRRTRKVARRIAASGRRRRRRAHSARQDRAHGATRVDVLLTRFVNGARLVMAHSLNGEGLGGGGGGKEIKKKRVRSLCPYGVLRTSNAYRRRHERPRTVGFYRPKRPRMQL